jgi:hypothetical protein
MGMIMGSGVLNLVSCSIGEFGDAATRLNFEFDGASAFDISGNVLRPSMLKARMMAFGFQGLMKDSFSSMAIDRAT